MVEIIKQLKNKFPNIVKHQWISIGKREENSVLNRDIYILAYSKKYIKQMTGLEHECNNLLFVNSEVFLDRDEFKQFSDKVVKRAIKNPRYFFKLNQKLINSCKKIKNYSEQIKDKTFRGFKKKALKEIFSGSIEKLVELVSFSYLLQNQEEIPKRIIDFILKKRRSKKIDLLREKLLIPIKKKTLFQQESQDLLKIAQKIKENDYSLKKLPEEIKNKVLSHIKKYDWINSKYFNVKEVTYNETIERIASFLKLKQKENREEIAEDREKEFNQIIEQLKLNKNDLLLLNSVREQLYYKTLRKELIFLFSYAIRNLFLEIAKKEKLTYQEFISQTLDEINDFFNQNVVKKQELIKRIKGFHYIFLDGKKIVIPAEDLKIKTAQQPKIPVFKGTIGNRGRVRGTARVIKTKEELKKMKRGEILVIDVVSPDYVKYLHEISGIVTNAGGILSHAVLAARELNIPCIVGTKSATFALKTGDKIDLDANKGEIKIIKESRI